MRSPVRRFALPTIATLLFAACQPGLVHGQSRASLPDLKPPLPLVEVPAKFAGGHTLVLLMSGDGNWAATVQTLATTLADSGYAVVGLEARSYMSKPRTAAGNAHDAEMILRHYLQKWGRDSVVIAGYSRGADWAPIIAARLPADLRSRVRLVAMLSPGNAASYEFSWSDLVMENKRSTDIPTLPIIESLRGMSLLCVYGVEDERNAVCPMLPKGMATVIVRPGGHRPSDLAHVSEPLIAALGGADRNRPGQ